LTDSLCSFIIFISHKLITFFLHSHHLSSILFHANHVQIQTKNKCNTKHLRSSTTFITNRTAFSFFFWGGDYSCFNFWLNLFSAHEISYDSYPIVLGRCWLNVRTDKFSSNNPQRIFRYLESPPGLECLQIVDRQNWKKKVNCWCICNADFLRTR